MEIIRPLARKAAHSKHIYFIEYVRHGWNNYSFIFYIGGISAILGKLFGVAGWLSVIVTVYFFYFMGKFKKEIELEKESISRKKKGRK